MSHRILLIDDEDDILEFIRYNLTKAGYEVYTARNGAEGLQQAAAHRPHLIPARYDDARDGRHRNLPGSAPRPGAEGNDGRLSIGPRRRGATTRRIRRRGGRLHPQADQAQTSAEPHPGDSQTGRRRQAGFAGHRPGTTSGNPRRRTYRTAPQRSSPCSPLLASSPGKLFSREEIYSRIWGDTVVVGDRTIDVHVRKIRQKIGNGHISTVKGLGYKYEN